MTTMMGYTVEQTERGYTLRGPRVTYTLIRTNYDANVLFVLNSKGKVGNVKGVEQFSDRTGQLRALA